MPAITANRPQSGFTLIEVLLVAPIIILAVMIVVGLMVVMTGDVIISRQRVAFAYSNQTALDQIEQDIRTGTQALATSGSLPSPQGSDAGFTGTAAFANPGSYLVIEANATTANPIDSTRQLVFYASQPYACGSANESNNSTMRVKIIYYVDGTTLRRRTIVPSYTSSSVCQTPWQRNSCKNGSTAASICQGYDDTVASNVSAFTVSYYPNSSSTTSVPSPDNTTGTVVVSLTQSGLAAGGTVSYTGTMRASLLNVR